MNSDIVIFPFGSTDVVTRAEAIRFLHDNPEKGVFFDPKTVFDGTIAYWAYGPVVHTGDGEYALRGIRQVVHLEVGHLPSWWENMPFDHGMQLVFISEDAMHGKIICDYTGEEIMPSSYIVGNGLPGCLYDADYVVNGAETAASCFLDDLMDFVNMGWKFDSGYVEFRKDGDDYTKEPREVIISHTTKELPYTATTESSGVVRVAKYGDRSTEEDPIDVEERIHAKLGLHLSEDVVWLRASVTLFHDLGGMRVVEASEAQ